MSKFLTYLRTGTFFDERDFGVTKEKKIKAQDEVEFEKGDIKALIIAAMQTILPFFIAVIVIFTLFILFFTKVIM